MAHKENYQHVLIIEDKKGMRIVTLEQSSYSVGRDAKSGIILYDTQVSRHHATLVRTMDSKNNNYNYKIIDGDLNGKRSTNGLMINGKSSISQDLNHGDYIVFGGKAKASYQIIANQSDLEIFKDNQNNNTSINQVQATANVNDYSKQTLITKSEQLEQLSIDDLKKLASFPEFSPNPIIEINWQGEITYLNRAARLKFRDIQQNKTQHPVLADLLSKTSSKQGSLFLREVRIGLEVFEQYVHYLPESRLIRSYIFDFTKRKQIEVALRESEERYRALVRQSSEGILLVEAGSLSILEANQAYCNLLGYKNEEILTLNLQDIIPENCDVVEKNLARLDLEKEDLVGQSLHRRQDGSLVALAVSISKICYGSKDSYCFVVREQNSQKHFQENLQYKPFHDPLTSLPNSTLFYEHLTTAIANAQRYENMIALMLFDLEQFKNINNIYGHNIGDEVLKDLALRLKAGLRSGDTLARWGGDEFAVLMPRIVNVKDVPRISQRLQEIIQKPMEINGKTIQLKSNVGIAIYPKDGDSTEVLINNASSVLERIKKIMVVSEEQSKQKVKNISSRSPKDLLSEALEKNQFSLFYQPIVNLVTNELTGMEALLRWSHPQQGLLLPEKFLPNACENNLIGDIGDWVIESACVQVKQWQEEGLLGAPVTVNVSEQEIMTADFAAKIQQTLQKNQVLPEYLVLEIAEKTLTENQTTINKILEDLRGIGVGLSLDDYGMASPGVNLLQQFKFSTVKIHQYLIGNLRNAPQDLGMISAMLTLAKSLNMRVVAEGVEEQEQLDLLLSVSCEEIQGYLISKPLDAEKATSFLERGKFGLNN